MSSKTSTSVPSKKELIADLKLLASKNQNVPITRNFYRANGKFKESHWQRYFPSFTLFLQDSGVFKPQVLPKPAPDKKELSETSEVVGDNWTITLPKTRISTLEQLLEYANVDLSVWSVERWVSNKWEVGAKDDAGKIVIEPLFQVKATLVRRKDIATIRAEIESLKEDAKKYAPIQQPVVRLIPRGGIGSGNLLELMIPDLHAGKLCWSKETGYQDYDTSIAVATYRRAVDGLLQLASGYKFDKIILGAGNDLLQSDNIQGTTYSGTKVDTDSRFHKTYKIVRKMLTETIEKLRLLAPVEVKLVPGNHDTLSTFTLGDSLECRFHNYSDVTVDNSPSMHKIVEWGHTFLVLTHGHEGKQADYAAWIASQYPQEFGRTKFREVHVGHKHKSSLDEKFGVRVRTLSSLTPPDAWHAHNNFVSNLRVAEALVFNKERGLVAQFYHTEVD
jgi:hypothetical protein